MGVVALRGCVHYVALRIALVLTAFGSSIAALMMIIAI